MKTKYKIKKHSDFLGRNLRFTLEKGTDGGRPVMIFDCVGSGCTHEYKGKKWSIVNSTKGIPAVDTEGELPSGLKYTDSNIPYADFGHYQHFHRIVGEGEHRHDAYFIEVYIRDEQKVILIGKVADSAAVANTAKVEFVPHHNGVAHGDPN